MATITEMYLSDRGGDPLKFRTCLTSQQRLGQAFFNALGASDQERLSDTIYDPFYKDDAVSVWRAIEWLLDTEDSKDPLYLRPSRTRPV